MIETGIIIALAVLGLIAHFIKKVVEHRQSGNKITFRQYYLENPYQSALSVILCAAGILMLWGSDELTRISAFTFGYMSDSVIAMISRRQA